MFDITTYVQNTLIYGTSNLPEIFCYLCAAKANRWLRIHDIIFFMLRNVSFWLSLKTKTNYANALKYELVECQRKKRSIPLQIVALQFGSDILIRDSAKWPIRLFWEHFIRKSKMFDKIWDSTFFNFITFYTFFNLLLC